MHVFGPVPSRRLGNSLGVSLIPSKVCSLSCIYCQIGKTDKYSITPKSYFDKNIILAEIQKAIESSQTDYITFAGDGEPTLSSDLGWILQECKKNFNLPTAVITNATLINNPLVSTQLQYADIVLPSIDAGCEETFKKINRPHKGINFYDMITGLKKFSSQFSGEIWTETMLVRGYNDNLQELNKINTIIKEVSPTKSFIMSPTRPPQVKIEKPLASLFFIAGEIINNSVLLDSPESGDFNVENYNCLSDAIQNIAFRHPLRLSQAESIATHFSEDLHSLVYKGAVKLKSYDNIVYVIPKIKRKK